MGEEEYQMITTKFSQQEDKDNSNRVSEWEDGLPSGDDLPPLSQSLISPELASAFSITPEPCKTYMDVNRASQITLSNLRKPLNLNSTTNIKQLPSFNLRRRDVVDVVKENEEEGGAGESQSGGSDDVRKVRRVEDTVEVYSAMEKDKENSNEPQQQNEAAAAAAAAAKRARLVWTPQLHKRFVDAVSHLGIKSAVPKTIMQLMNVEGLTRENVASHLQKYRLYLKRMQGLSNEGPAPSDQLFASTPVPQSFREAVGGGGGGGGGNVASVPMPYGVAMLPFMSMGHGHGGMVPGMVPYHGLDPNQSNVLREQQKDWSGSKFGSIMSQQHVNSHHKGRLSNHS